MNDCQTENEQTGNKEHMKGSLHSKKEERDVWRQKYLNYRTLTILKTIPEWLQDHY